MKGPGAVEATWLLFVRGVSKQGEQGGREVHFRGKVRREHEGGPVCCRPRVCVVLSAENITIEWVHVSF